MSFDVYPARLKMRKSLLLVAVCALLIPVAALADDSTPSPSAVASSMCKQLQTTMGATFAATYGTNGSKANAFGKCVSKNAAAAQQDVSNAAKTCKAQQADAGFAAAHGGKTFDQFYGTNAGKGKGAGSNAFGKCVSALAKQSSQAQTTAVVSAAKACKSAMKSDPSGFATKYGKAKNAFGKCVAATAKTK
jgi:hypothetical protein